MKPSLRKILLYILYCLALASVLFVWKFPYKSLGPWLERRVEQATGMKLDISGMSASPPLAFGFDKVELRNGDGDVLFAADNAEVSVHILPLLLGRASFDFQGDAYGGSLQGSGDLDSWLAPTHAEVALTAVSLKLERHPYLQKLLKAKVTGSLSATMSLSGPPARPAELAGALTLSLGGLDIPVNTPLVRSQDIAQGRLDASVTFGKGLLKVDKGQFEAKGLKGTLDGTIELKPQFRDGGLSLTGTTSFDPAMYGLGAMDSPPAPGSSAPQAKTLPFKIGGKVGAPTFSIS